MQKPKTFNLKCPSCTRAINFNPLDTTTGVCICGRYTIVPGDDDQHVYGIESHSGGKDQTKRRILL